MQTFHVLVARFRLEATVVKVDAEADDVEARALEAAKAARFLECKVDNVADQEFVVQTIDGAEHEAYSRRTGETPEEAAWQSLESFASVHLIADLDTGEGAVLPAPWLGDVTEPCRCLLVGDITADWLAQLPKI